MKEFKLEVIDSKKQSYEIVVQTLPDKCPFCHQGIEPTFIQGFMHDNDYPSIRTVQVQTIFQCPIRQCQRFFIVDYVQRNENWRDHSNPPFEINDILPFRYLRKKFPDVLEKISPLFCKVFNETACAEAFKLLNVAGPGYGKALEFLIKDYLSAKNPDQSESIKAKLVSILIKDYIQDENIKKCAERATWLRNDETHYIRKWENHNIEDLKRLIELTANWIENNLITQEYLNKMPEGKKNKRKSKIFFERTYLMKVLFTETELFFLLKQEKAQFTEFKYRMG